MRFEKFAFGFVRIDGITYEHDIVIDRLEIRKRRKKPSKEFRDAYGHTPLSSREEIPWDCRRLIIGTGAHGALPLMKDVEQEARRRGIELIALPTDRAIDRLQKEDLNQTNAILHVTC